MKWRYLLVLGGVVLPLVAAAQEPDTSKAQPELPKEKLIIVSHDGKDHVFDVEMATTSAQQTVGEMFRTSIPEDGGMLFDWVRPQATQMWMKNTLVPMDMVFINGDGTIRSIGEDTTPRSLAVIDSRGPVRATLEINAGTTAKLDIRVGDVVKQRIFGNAP
jgi:uncharacterized membrane protein (UPF0127 family)